MPPLFCHTYAHELHYGLLRARLSHPCLSRAMARDAGAVPSEWAVGSKQWAEGIELYCPLPTAHSSVADDGDAGGRGLLAQAAEAARRQEGRHALHQHGGRALGG